MEIELRPLTEADAESVHAITRVAEVADGAHFATSLTEIETRLTAPHLHLSEDTRLAVVDGSPAGFAVVDHAPSGERLERAFLWGEVHPDHRGRGIGSTLFAWELARAVELLQRYDHDLPRFARTTQRAARTDALALYERNGLAPARYTDELIRPIDGPVDPRPVAGITIVPWDHARSDEVRRVKNAAFADHWGSTPSDEAAWAHWLSDESVRLDLSWLALEGDEVVGYSLNDHYPDDEAVTGQCAGWISSVGVVPSHRKRGIASALITASIAGFHEAGFSHAMLDVDTENPSGAYGVYQRLGFEPFNRWVVHEVEVPRLDR